MEDINLTYKEPNKEWNLQITPKYILINERFGTIQFTLSYDDYPQFRMTRPFEQYSCIEVEGIFVTNTFKMFVSYKDFYDESGITDNDGRITLEIHDVSFSITVPYYLAKCLVNAGKGILDLEGSEEGITFVD